MEEVSFMAIDLPIPPEDLAQIQGMLRSENPFCSSFPDEPLYSVMLYQQHKHLHGTETRMLLDRNIYARLLRLAKGHPASGDYRIPAAVMGFAQCAGILLERIGHKFDRSRRRRLPEQPCELQQSGDTACIVVGARRDAVRIVVRADDEQRTGCRAEARDDVLVRTAADLDVLRRD